MNYLTNDRNLARAGALTATNIVPSGVVYRIDEGEKAGGGTVALTGAFAGDSDRVFDVEVLDESGTDRGVSAPVFAGTGNGTMTAVSAGLTVDAQEVTVTLVNLGTETRAARSPFEGVAIVARDAGADGNAITVSIDTSAIVATQSPLYLYSLPEPLQAGQNEYRGVGWNFATPYLTANGEVPAESPRLRVGDDPQVYRPYRRRVGTADVFGFSPAPVRDVAAGAPVKLVTGSYTITVSDGDTEEELTEYDGNPIVTLFEALSALAGSALVRVDGAVVNDLQPGGQGCTELAVRTRPYVTSIERDGTSYVRAADIGLIAGVAAPSETLRIVCQDVSDAGRERWSAEADVSGVLGTITTAVPFSLGPYSGTIPLPAASSAGVQGSITARYVRPSGAGVLPNFEAEQAVLGIAARNGTFVFEWQEVPVVCTERGELIGGPSAFCLGLLPPNEQGDTAMTGASRLRRMQRLARFLHEFAKANTVIPPIGGAVDTQYNPIDSGDVAGQSVTRKTVQSSVAEQDIKFVKEVGAIYMSVLRKLQDDAVLDFPLRTTSMPVTKDMVVMAEVAGVGYKFVANNAGTTHVSDTPSWSATLGATVTDGDVEWQNEGKVPMAMFDDAIALLESDSALLKGTAFDVAGVEWAATTPFKVGQVTREAMVDRPDVIGIYRVTVAGTSDSTKPDFPDTIAGTVVDGTVTWELVGVDSYRTEGAVVTTPPAGGSSTAEAGQMQFEIQPGYYERYRTMGDMILTAAGLDPGFEEAGDQSGDGCSPDYTDVVQYFACITPDADYAPMLPNVYYHASKRAATGEYRSTKEFGIGPVIGCAGNIALGDQIVVTISNVNGVSTYQQGDEFVVTVVRAEPVALTGGQDGDDTLTWTVEGGEAGMLPPYALDLDAPATYLEDGIGFTITPGAIPFALGDSFRFAVQAARGQWRVDGGAWSSPFAIGSAPVVLADGLSAVFTEGPAPSWVPGDRWSFRAEAVNGVDQLRQPTDGRCAWSGSTVIEVAGGAIDGVLLGDHSIPSDATITLTGSDDGFATTPLSVAIPWRRGSIWQAVIANRAEYRLTIDRGGSMNWWWLGEPLQLELQGGLAELGSMTMRYRLPGASQRAGVGATVEHDGVAQDSFEAWLAAISAACSDDDRRIGVVPVETAAEAGIVTIDAHSIEVSDVFRFQPANTDHRILSFSVDLAPIA